MRRAIASFALIALLIALLSAVSRAAELPAMPDIAANDRVLVVAPHPDDETLCCAGLLQRAHTRGATIAIVWITAGDGFDLDAMWVERTVWPHGEALRRLGAQRVLEAQHAANLLSVPADNQYFLDFPDRGVAALLGSYLQKPYESPYTHAHKVPYADAYTPDATYTGANLSAELSHVLDVFHPTLVLAAAPEDTHPDHSFSGVLVRSLLTERGELSQLRYWIVHAPHWPRPERYRPELTLKPPPTAANHQWQTLVLTDQERAHKLEALRAHASQIDIMSPFLTSFVRANELFALP